MDIISEILELFGAAYLGDFSKYMFQAGAYGTVFYVMLLLPLLVAFVYYIVLDHILLAQLRKWLIIGVSTSAVAALVAMFIAHQQIDGFTFSQNILIRFHRVLLQRAALFRFLSSPQVVQQQVEEHPVLKSNFPI